MITVIPKKNDDGIVSKALIIEGLQRPSYLRIDIANACVISMTDFDLVSAESRHVWVGLYNG